LSDETKHLAAVKQNFVDKKKSNRMENIKERIILVHFLKFFLFMHHNGA
jgi:hypothetical protein